MTNVLIVSHGRLAAELLAAGRTIAGSVEKCEALCLDWQASAEQIAAAIAQAIEGLLKESDAVLVLTDIFGSTPTNAALKLRQPGRVAVVAGVNLPMVVRLSCARPRQMPLAEMAAWIEGKGRSSICCGCETTPQEGESCDG